jgi:DNA-binding NarL/FixJ family response regulator
MLRLAMQINRAAGPQPATAPPAALLVDKKTPGPANDLPGSAGRHPQSVPADPPRVLLVDDSETTLALARAVLSAGCGCVVVATASNGQAALAAAAAQTPDVVVLDISMPDMNGFELARRLRAAGCTAQLVYLTVHEEDELVLAARNAGALGYVVKTRINVDLERAVLEARAGRPFQSPPR